MVNPLGVLKSAYDLYKIFDSYGEPDPLTVIQDQLTEIKTLTLQVLTDLDDARELAISNFVNPIQSDLSSTINSWYNYTHSGSELYKTAAILDSKDALSDIITYLANPSLTYTEKAMLAPILVEAIGIRLKVIIDLEDGAFAGGYQAEINGARDALDAILPDIKQVAEDNIVIKIVSVTTGTPTIYYPGGFLEYTETIAVSFTTGSDPETTGQINYTFTQERLHDGDVLIDGIFGGLLTWPDGSWVNGDPTGREVDTVQLLAWMRANGLENRIEAYIQPTIDLDFQRSYGPEIEAIYQELTELTSGQYEFGTNGVDFFISDSSASYTSPDTFIGNGGDDYLQGGGGNDTLRGGGGNDVLVGGAGHDFMEGGSGDDWIYGGTGNDRINGGNGIDTLLYEYSAVGVNVSLEVIVRQDTGQGLDTITNIENLRGSSHDDMLFGDSNANHIRGGRSNDWIKGRGGNDTLDGGEDDDVIDGGGGNDTAVYILGNLAAYVDLSILTAQNTGQGVDTLISIENLTTGSGDDILTGDAGNNRLIANAGKDALDGGAGGDVLDGGDGVDAAKFLGGADTTVDLRILTAQNTGHGNDTLIDIENVYSGGGADTLIGNDAKTCCPAAVVKTR